MGLVSTQTGPVPEKWKTQEHGIGLRNGFRWNQGPIDQKLQQRGEHTHMNLIQQGFERAWLLERSYTSQVC